MGQLKNIRSNPKILLQWTDTTNFDNQLRPTQKQLEASEADPQMELLTKLQIRIQL